MSVLYLTFSLQFFLVCVALTCGVQGGPQPRCRTVYETKYTTTYEEKCETTYEVECKTIYRIEESESCKEVYETVPGKPHPEKRTKCFSNPRKVPDTTCDQVPKENCTQVPVQTPTQVSKQECDKEPGTCLFGIICI